MSKFILPNGVIKVKGSIKLDIIFPVGTLFQHVQSGLYFRFMSRGGRWDKEFLITTDRGFFCLNGFFYPIGENHLYSDPDKNKLVAKLLDKLNA